MRKSIPLLVVLILAAVFAGLQLAPRSSTSDNSAMLLSRLNWLAQSSSSSSVMTLAERVAARRAALIQRNKYSRPDPRQLHAAAASYAASASSLDPTTINTGLTAARCGDGIITGTEQCDDHNTQSGDGCDTNCKIETGYLCGTTQPSYCWSTCGDGIVATNEKCDDGNNVDNDGCTKCRIDVGYKCSGSPSVCTPIYTYSSSSSS